MEKNYSIAILPSESIISLIKSMKEKLAAEIGWFHSKNSVAHITICLFKVNNASIIKIKNQLTQLCDSLEPAEIHLTELDSFPNGAFFMAPDKISKNKLLPIMKKVHHTLRGINIEKSTNPHLSIARRLSQQKLQKAVELFPTVDLAFLCDSIVLREFDENTKQYFVTDTFKFHNNPKEEFIQGTLF